MNYEVFVSQEVEDDIFEIYNFILENDSQANAAYVFTNIKQSCLKLNSLPGHGHTLPELERIQIFEYKEIHFKPYRIIYQVLEHKVYIHYVFDGRRDLHEVLERRLLR